VLTLYQLCSCYRCIRVRDSFLRSVLGIPPLPRGVDRAIASGLLYISELIEEHSQLAKTVGKRGLYVSCITLLVSLAHLVKVVILLHVLLYFIDSLPFKQTAFSILCHIVYLQNFSSSWPLISLTSASFLASCVLVLADHFTWFFYFARVTHEARHTRPYLNPSPRAPGFPEIASFFALCVWLVPLFLFLSLSANDNTLPMSAGKYYHFVYNTKLTIISAEPGTPTTSGFAQVTQTRISLIRSIFALFSFEIFPRVRPKNLTSEGLIAPRSPQIPQSPVPTSPRLVGSPRLTHSSTLSPYIGMSPPRSPGSSTLRDGEFEASLPTKSDFKLVVSPDRRPGIIARRQTSDGRSLVKRFAA
jgi:hypothetical protein